jgi:hypothetical protein
MENNEDYNTESNYWIEKSANLGNAEAQFELAEICKHEKNDQAKYLEWLEKSARNGNTKAKHNLATNYLSLYDYQKAFYWMELASNEGHAGAKRKLGIFYYDGISVSVDKEKGLSLIHEAAALGDEHAKEMLENDMK